jgi:hypothetical protein
MKKQKRNGVSKEYLFCLSDVSLERYDTSKFEKNKHEKTRKELRF